MLFFILNKLCILLFPGFQFNITTVLSVFPAFMLGFSILSLFFISPLQNALSRYFEKQADEYALNVTGKPNAFMTAMAGLADRNLSNAYPPKWLKIMFYSHPPVGERLKHGEHYKLKESE